MEIKAMTATLPLPKTLQEAVKFFSDEQRTFDYAVRLRWPDGGVTCPRCGSTEHSFISTRRIWWCKGCKKQFTVKVGTIFEDSALGMDKWMIAVWMICNCKNGISSYEVGRALGITQKSAWFMLHRIRLAMQRKGGKMLGGEGKEIEADESFIGGLARFMHTDKRKRLTGTGGKDKATAFGILERGGEVRTFAVPNRKRRALQAEIRNHVQAGSAIYTDALLSYVGLRPDYAHQVVDHAERYVDGRIHTNGLENFWSLLKRGLKGTYVAVEPFHLFRYLDEQAFRYNLRKTKDAPYRNDGERFQDAMSHVFGRRLTYAQLTGKDADALHHETTGAGQAQ
jgi:transposase-like protein